MKSWEEQMKGKEKKHQEDLRFYSKEKRQLKELAGLKVANSRLQKRLESEMKAHEEEREILRTNQEMQRELEMLKTRVPTNNMQLVSTRSGTQGQTQTNGQPKLSIDHFHPIRILGEGGFGKVVLAKKRASDKTDQSFAIKIIKKSLIISCGYESFAITEKEALVLTSGHPFITTLYSCFQMREHLFFVMEYVSGGNMATEMQKVGVFSEKRAQFYVAEVTLALEFLHRQGILHRDLKLENILIDGDGHCKVADFGLSQLGVFRGQKTDKICGTPCYMAPELLQQQPYGHGVDWWALGIVLYAMLAGRLPFNDTDGHRLRQKIMCHDVVYPEWISEEAVLIKRRLLKKDPLLRLGTYGQIKTIREQPFFRGIDWRALLEKRVEPPHKPNIVQETEEHITFENLLKPDNLTYMFSKEDLDGFSYVNHGFQQ